jgi:hypothetical protein
MATGDQEHDQQLKRRAGFRTARLSHLLNKFRILRITDDERLRRHFDDAIDRSDKKR